MEPIDSLERLRFSLERLYDRLEKSGIRRTFGLGLEMGEDCPYTQKSFSIFIKKDFNDILKLVEEARANMEEYQSEQRDSRED